MKKKIEEIQKQYASDLSKSALDYLKTGLELFHKRRFSDYLGMQTSLGNISISIELMIKAFLADKNLALIFKGLPLELKVILTCPDSIPENSNWRNYDLNFRFGSYKTLEFDECVSSFYIFKPDVKQSLHSHLRIIAKSRNASVHSIFPNLQKYEIERAAYVALQLLETMKDTTLFKFSFLSLTDADKKFLSEFKEERIERVKKAIEKAKEKAHRLENFESYISVDSWEVYITSCPVCGCDALLEGYTEPYADQDGEDSWSAGLDFFADTFRCENCGLSLEDSDEIRLAGIDTHFDRSDETDKYPFDDMGDY